jgi:hypothetical protein
MINPPNYRKLYAEQEAVLSDLLAQKEAVENKILMVRKHLQTLAEICQNEKIEIETSLEAAFLLENTNLADEIRSILKSNWPAYLRPNLVKGNLESLGHDLSRYQNPQSVIQMLLKRLAESGEVEEGTIPEDGKKVYRSSGPQTWNQPLKKLGHSHKPGTIGSFGSNPFDKKRT